MNKISKGFIVILIAAGLTVLSACAQAQGSGLTPSATPEVSPMVTDVPSGTPVGITPEEPGSTPTGQTSGDGKVITLDDQGKTINLQVGERFLLQLGEQYTWDISISDPSVLSRVPNILVVRGAQGIYEAHQAGSVTLSATGDPACRQLKPACAMPSLLVTVTIVVS